MVLCSFFPRADCGRGGLHMALRRRVILLNHFSPVLRHFSKSCGGSARPFPWFESPYACARFYLWHFLVCFSIMRCVLPELASVNGVSSGMGACNSKRTSFRAGTVGAFRVASVWREGKHHPHRQVEVREIGQTCERGGESGAGEAVEGEFRRRKAERCAQVRCFC